MFKKSDSLIFLFLPVYSQKFFKHHYVAIIDRAEIVNLNTSIANASFGMHFCNRTTKSLHGFLQLLIDLPEDSTVFAADYQMFDNEYKLTAIQFKVKFRQGLQIDIAGIQDLFYNFKPPLVWCLKKRVIYKLDNWVQNSTKIQFPFRPTGWWKLVLSFYSDKLVTKMFDFNFYETVKDISDID